MVDGGNCKPERVKVLHLSLKHQADFDNGCYKDICDDDLEFDCFFHIPSELSVSLPGSLIRKVGQSIWALPIFFFLGGGSLNGCQDGLGHLFREELSKFK